MKRIVLPLLLSWSGVWLSSPPATLGQLQPLSGAAWAAADSGQFPLQYCTALPRADFAYWDADYARYNRFLTPEIRRTQQGLQLVDKAGVHIWSIRPAAAAPPQLDTLTRIADPARVQGRWRAISNRRILYRDSAVLAEKRFYRTMQQLPLADGQAEMTLATGRISLLASDKPGTPLRKQFSKNYDVVSGRYLLVYGLARAGGGISQVGLDAQGRLLLHSYAVVERKLPGQYQTYETVLSQTIFERVAP